ncbi:hypothetical protein A0J61_03101 [Choanephora cucurbitarum]|uniref:Uncharacterized protein n=1 Tax=Choanephora cucurbitarum TaxID=101091 RepID=A0A1C7NIM9_9FUNG|nr:hypothetical protein A0J61_03101 [Choanephora cucurbitarum]
MSECRFSHTDKPHLRAHLLQLEELQQQYFRDHPKEDQEEVRYFEAGHFGRSLVSRFSENLVETDLKERENC